MGSPDGARILTLNAGSSSLKYALFAGGARVARGTVERIGEEGRDHARALAAALEDLARQGGVDGRGLEGLAAVGHRVVHGGDAFVTPTRIDDAVVAELERLAVLDPEHLPAEIAIVAAVRERSPALLQVACFDTAFHATIPRVARLLPLPREITEPLKLRRYGFHGLSYQFVRDELSRTAGNAAARGRVVMAHLGSGASLAAMRDGASVDTTMGFTPNSGVPMGTRSGDVEPGVLLRLLREGSTVDELDDLLSRRSGLRGVSGTSGDMRDLLAREETDPAAADAVAIFVYQVKKAIGALAATLDGLDTLVFTGGIGENAPLVRARVCAGLGHLGVALDPARNAAGVPLVSTDASRGAIRVIRTDEEAVIARETARLLPQGK